MPEPITLVIIGSAAWAFLRRQQGTPPAEVARVLPGAPGSGVAQLVGPATAGAGGQPLSTAASGTGPTAPLATLTAVVNGVPIGAVPTATIRGIPPLAVVLDNDTALLMRQYAALHPEDFQVFLDRYADFIVLRDDMFFEALTDPPAGGYKPTPMMAVTLGAATYKIVAAFNGVAAGNYGDLFGVASTVAGNLPGLNPDFVHALQGLTLGYRAFTAVLTTAQIAEIAAANGVSIMNVTGVMLETGGQVESLGMGAGAAGLAGMPIASMAGVLMAAGLCLDIGFTIAGNAPDVQKAVDVALDVAALVCLFIPVIGWVIAIVIELVKFIIDCFASDLFYSHAQQAAMREKIEAATYGEHLSRMFPQIADAYSPRELFQRIVQWGSGYCGGVQDVAMMVAVNLKAGDRFMVGGRLYTMPADGTLQLGNQPGCYWFAGGPFEQMTNDEQAWTLARYATENGVTAAAQVGVSDALKAEFELPTKELIEARAAPLKTFCEHGVSLDGVDLIVAEYRAQPALHDLASVFGYQRWQDMLGAVLVGEWTAGASTVTHGTLTDFAKSAGYPTMHALRAAAFAPWQAVRDHILELEARESWLEAHLTSSAPYTLPSTDPTPAELAMLRPGDVVSETVLRRIVALEARVTAYDQARAAEAAVIADARAAALALTATPDQMALVTQTAQTSDEALYWMQIQEAITANQGGGSNGG